MAYLMKPKKLHITKKKPGGILGFKHVLISFWFRGVFGIFIEEAA